jgi:hypothetical protein
VTETGFGLVFGFINHLQAVTTNNYNSFTLQRLHINQSFYSHVNSSFSLLNFRGCLLPRTLENCHLIQICWELLLQTPINPWIWHTGKRFHCCVVANACRHCWRGHATAPPPATSKCLQRLPGNTKWGDATRIAIRSRLGSAILGTARRKHRFVYYCVIAGACFDVTILTWRIYATISKHDISGTVWRLLSFKRWSGKQGL